MPYDGCRMSDAGADTEFRCADGAWVVLTVRGIRLEPDYLDVGSHRKPG
jgi:hypothetical protein